MRLLVTRPEPDASELKAQLEALGHEVLLEPLLRIELLPIVPEAIFSAQALLVTSRNGVRAIAASEALSAARKLPVYCVGEETAALARAAGFGTVAAGAGRAQDLVPLLKRELKPDGGALLHIAGEQLAFDLAGALTQLGFTVRTLTAYRGISASRLSQSAAAGISAGSIGAVLLMSPRTASIFAKLVEAAGLAHKAAKLDFICLSEAVAGGLGALAPDRRRIAKTPNRAGIIAAVGRVASKPTEV
jgi:uroporphyrinogen-III synthase